MAHVVPTTFCQVANTVYSIADRIGGNYEALIKALGDCSQMSGSDETGRAWGEMFQGNAAQLASTVEQMVNGLRNYAGILYQLGQNHAQAETASGGGPVELPTEAQAGIMPCYMVPNCVGGSGQGMQSFVDLANEIGIPIPDGDTGKLEHAHDALTAFASFGGGELTAASQLIDVLSSPDVDVVVEDLEELQSVIDETQEIARKLAESCLDHRDWLDKTRHEMIEQLKALGEELAVDLAEGIALSFITVGIGALVKTAQVASKISKYGKIIRGLLDAAKGANALGRAGYLQDASRFARWGKQIERFKFLRRVDASDANKWAKTARIKGRVGEDAAGIEQKAKRAVEINGRSRVPERIDEKAREVEEVKNVKNLSYSQQIKDMQAYAEQQGYKFTLTVDNGTQLTGPLQQAVDRSEIVLRRIDMSR